MRSEEMWGRRLANAVAVCVLVFGLGCTKQDDEDGSDGGTTDEGGSEGGTTDDDGSDGGTTDDGGTDGSGTDGSGTEGSGEQPEAYGDCPDRYCIDPSEECLQDDLNDPTFTVCATPCETAETCPEAPPTGDAPVACTDVAGDQTSLFCILDCSNGQTCPDGMRCQADTLCVW